LHEILSCKYKKYLYLFILLFVLFAILVFFVIIFGLEPFNVAKLFKPTDIFAVEMQKYTLKPPNAQGYTGGTEWSDPVNFNNKDDISEIYRILSKYQFRKHLFSPQRNYSKDVTIIRLVIGFRENRYFSLEVTDSAYSNLLSLSKNEIAPGADYSIDYIGHGQQAELYNALSDFMAAHS